MTQIQRHIESSTNHRVWLKSLAMLYLMRLMALQESKLILMMYMKMMFQRSQYAPRRLEMCNHRNKRARSTFFLNNGAPPTQDDEQVHQEEACDQGGAQDDQVMEEEAPQAPPTLVRATIQRNHPVDQILGDISKGVTTRSRLVNFCEYYSFVSSIEPFRVEEALLDPDMVLAM
jgi:hypothetical protein